MWWIHVTHRGPGKKIVFIVWYILLEPKQNQKRTHKQKLGFKHSKYHSATEKKNTNKLGKNE
jgi:hypothetical protein